MSKLKFAARFASTMNVMSRDAAEKSAMAKIAAAHADIAKICSRKGSVVLEIYMADLQVSE